MDHMEMERELEYSQTDSRSGTTPAVDLQEADWQGQESTGQPGEHHTDMAGEAEETGVERKAEEAGTMNQEKEMEKMQQGTGTEEVREALGVENPRETEDTAEGQEEMAEGQEEEEAADGIAAIEHLLDERIVRAIREMGFEKLSPIQEQAIPYLLEGEDIIGQAQTGTGKTAAFGIPMLQKVDPGQKKLQGVILCPTRELAIQAAEELRKIAKYMHGVKILPVYGGQEIGKQISGLRGVQIIVGTPGRVMDHMRRHTLKLEDVNMVVLDEADEMLNMGFREDMELILGQIPNEHQTALFSATMPKPILEITGQFQKDAKLVKVAAQELTIPLVSQKYYRVRRQDKDAACIRLLEYYQPRLCLIFCNTKMKVDELAEALKKAGFYAEGLHGDMSQHQRDVAMGRFRNGTTNILIATDVAARGIDVEDVEIVINYDIPQDIEYYVHRIGRTGRAGKTGRSCTFVAGKEVYRIRDIERVCHTTIEEKRLPGASKVLKSKADRYLNKAWELREHEDIELMKAFLQRKMNAEDCDALELAAVMLKAQVGDRGEEIPVDELPVRRKPGDRKADRGREDRRGFGGRGNREERRGRGDREDRRGREERRGREDRGENREERRRREYGDDRGIRRENREERRGREDRGENREERRRREYGDDRGIRRENREERRRREYGDDRGIRYGSREERGGREEKGSRWDRGDREGRGIAFALPKRKKKS